MISLEHLVAGLLVVVIVAVLAIATTYIWTRLRIAKERERAAQQIAAVSKKAAVSALAMREDSALVEAVEDDEEPLSESSVFAIQEMLEALIARGDLEAAEVWAENILRSNPEQLPVAVQLAEIHHQRGERSDFFHVLSQYLIARRDELGAETWSRLEKMLADFASSTNRHAAG